jgi:hypothetical protein
MLATPGILNKIEEGVEMVPDGHTPHVPLSLAKLGEAGCKDDLQVCVCVLQYVWWMGV